MRRCAAHITKPARFQGERDVYVSIIIMYVILYVYIRVSGSGRGGGGLYVDVCARGTMKPIRQRRNREEKSINQSNRST